MALTNLIKEMAGAGITNEALAEITKTHRNTIANKLAGESKFSIQEAILIHDKFFPNLGFEFLFEDDSKR